MHARQPKLASLGDVGLQRGGGYEEPRTSPVSGVERCDVVPENTETIICELGYKPYGVLMKISWDKMHY